MEFLEFKHHGAVDGVTGSCHELRFKEGTGIDHVGRIPYLLAKGFNKSIYCFEASVLLRLTAIKKF